MSFFLVLILPDFWKSGFRFPFPWYKPASGGRTCRWCSLHCGANWRSRGRLGLTSCCKLSEYSSLDIRPGLNDRTGFVRASYVEDVVGDAWTIILGDVFASVDCCALVGSISIAVSFSAVGDDAAAAAVLSPPFFKRDSKKRCETRND